MTFLRQLYYDQLAQASYLVGCAATGEALVVDPNRDLDQYFALAEREGFRITAITETHIHADFVSGAHELAQRSGARLYLSAEGAPDWQYAFAQEAGAVLLHDGDTIMVGNLRLDVLHTPGHIPEHLAFLLTDTKGADAPMGLFTGDFVFVGDVGRPDLLERAAGYAGTMEAGARRIYASLQRFQDLPDYLQVWPGHGAGSACGKALSAVPQSTVGYEKRFNWGLQIHDEDTRRRGGRRHAARRCLCWWSYTWDDQYSARRLVRRLGRLAAALRPPAIADCRRACGGCRGAPVTTNRTGHSRRLLDISGDRRLGCAGTRNGHGAARRCHSNVYPAQSR
jgi:glyoxylase-like metal-dependent hydrolase (beta-lactamase superfamily II)